jgi:hypothetical protein
MKIVSPRALAFSRRVRSPRRRQQGTAMIVVLVLLAIVLIYVGDNLKTLSHLSRELKLVEQHQLRRLHSVAGATNSVARVDSANQLHVRGSPTDPPWTASPPSVNR